MKNNKNNEGRAAKPTVATVELRAGLTLDGSILMRGVSAAAHVICNADGTRSLRVEYAFDMRKSRIAELMSRHLAGTVGKRYHFNRVEKGMPVAVYITRDMAETAAPYLTIVSCDGEGQAGNYMPGPIMVTLDSSPEAVKLINKALGIEVFLQQVPQEFTSEHPQATAPGERRKRRRKFKSKAKRPAKELA